MRLDHIAYRVIDRYKTAKFLKSCLGYDIGTEFQIEFSDNTKADCLALTPPEERHPDVSEWEVYLADAPDEKIKKSGAIPIQNFKNNLSKMDAITLHCPKNEETTNLFTKKEFQTMKKNAFIINCARGGILNEDDLYEALLNEKIAGAGLDVFDVEPTPSSNPLFKLKNVILSPHIAGVTVESTVRMAIETVQNVLDVFDNKVNKSVVVNIKEIGMK